MNRSLWLLGLVFTTVGCPQNMPMPTEEDMKPAQVDMKKPSGCKEDEEGATSTGGACSKACQCAVPDTGKATCLLELNVLGAAFEAPGGYCSVNGCDPKSSTTTCGTGGICADTEGDGNSSCLQRCTKGKCRMEYGCANIRATPTSTSSSSVCLPKELFDCDPTADPTKQCTSLGGAMVSTLTNGAPNAACIRVGPDNVGQCLYPPCNIGPKNCPGNNGCFYIQTASAQNPDDKWKGPVCLPLSGNKKLGDACTGGITSCGDNLICVSGTCQQYCYRGMQMTYPGGNPMYKNAAAACPMGTMCKDIFMLGGATGPGVCQP